LLSSSTEVEKYRTINFPVVLYECESWSLTQREGHRLRKSENRVLGRIFGPQGNEVRGEWRTLHEEELNPLNAKLNPICRLLAILGAHHILHVSRIRVNDVYSSLNVVRVIKSRRMIWTGHVVCMG
jgi:hypothetical protein